MSKVRVRLGKEMAAQLLSIAVTLCDRLVLAALIVRTWGEEGFAHWTVIISAAGMLALFDLGLNYYCSNRLARLIVRGRAAKALHLFRAGTLMISTAVTFGMIVVAIGFLIYSKTVHAVGSDMWVGFAGVLAGTSCHYYVSQYYFLFRAHDRYATQTLLQAARDLSRVLFPAAAIVFGGGIAVAGLAYGVGSFVSTLPLLWSLVRRNYPKFTLRLELPDRPERRNVLTVGSAYWVQSAATTLLTFLPVFLIYGAASAIVVAQFALARTVANFVRMAQQLIGLVLGQEGARRIALAQTASVPALFFSGSRVVGVVSGCGAATLLVLGKPLFRLWTGSDTLYDPLLLAVALIPLAFAPTLLFTYSLFLSANRPRPLLIGRLTQLGLAIAAFFVLPLGSVALRMMTALTLGEVIGFGIPTIVALAKLIPEIGWMKHLWITLQSIMAALVTYGAGAVATLLVPSGWLAILSALAATTLISIALVLGVVLGRPWMEKVFGVMRKRSRPSLTK